MLDLDFSSLENSITKKSKKDLLAAIDNLNLENYQRQKLLFLVAGNFLVSIRGKPFLKKYASISLKNIFFKLYSYTDKSFPNQLIKLQEYAQNSDFESAQKLFFEMKKDQEEFSKLFMQFLIYYDLSLLFSFANKLYKKNDSLLTHFIKKIEDQYEINRLYLLPHTQLLNIHQKLESLVDDYFKKINSTVQKG